MAEAIDMKMFAQLYERLDTTTSTLVKVAAIREYVLVAPPDDAAWALWLLTGNRLKRLLKVSLLKEWAMQETGTSEWLFAESYAIVGDLAETIALLVEESHIGRDAADVGLAVWMGERLVGLRKLDETEQRSRITTWWKTLRGRELFVFNKLLTGGMRVGVSRTLVERAVAEAAGLPRPTVALRLMGNWEPDADLLSRLMAPEGTLSEDRSQPYPYHLAYALEVEELPELGERRDWQVEWKWDGIRGQLIRRDGETFLWTRGEELVTERYPEIAQMAKTLPEGTVIDGEIIGWVDDAPLPFQTLQKRIGRKKVSAGMLTECPCVLLCYDLMEYAGEDIRTKPLSERRRLMQIVVAASGDSRLVLSATIDDGWQTLPALRATSRERGAEGFMLKRLDSTYETGRKKGLWWKWKVDPMTIDAVLLYAQAGHGRRANQYTDYTFAVWDGDNLTPIAKAYSGLDNAEIKKLDSWIRKNTREKFGPVRSVEPVQVFEIGFEGIGESTRHKSGIAVRFPRILRWRTDKLAADADTLEMLRGYLAQSVVG
jgi:DNA ligase-1